MRYQKSFYVVITLMVLLCSMSSTTRGGQVDPDVLDKSLTQDKLNVIIYLRDQPAAHVTQEVKPLFLQRLRATSERIRLLTKLPKRPSTKNEKDEIRKAIADLKNLPPDVRAEVKSLLRQLDDETRLMRREMYSRIQRRIRVSQDQVQSTVELLGGKVVNKVILINAVAAEIPSDKLMEIARHPEVSYIGPNPIGQPQLDVSTRAISADTWWNASVDGGIWDIGIVDTGVDSSHPALRSHPFYGRSFDPNDLDPDDHDGHGTHVVGIVASTDGTFRGVAFGLDSIISSKIPAENATTAQAMEAFDWAVNSAGDDADVINQSYGYGTAIQDDTPFTRFFDAVVDDLLVPVAQAAGNSRHVNETTILYPANAYNLIVVGAMDDRGTTDRGDDIIWDDPTNNRGSSSGPTAGDRRKPDLVAPGSNIRSTYNDWEELFHLEQNFIDAPGTSMAAPHVAGAALLLMDYGILDPKTIKAILINTAEDEGDAGWDRIHGWGYIDLGAAFLHRDDYFEDSVSPQGSANDFVLYKGYLFGLDTATLVWHRHVDYAGATDPTTFHPLNNLNLYLYNHDTDALLNESDSDIDNVEQVQQPNAVNGEVIIKVAAASASFAGVNQEEYSLATEENFEKVSPPNFTITSSPSNPTDVGVGETFILTYTVKNTGEVKAHKVAMSLTASSNLTVIGAPSVNHFDLAPQSSKDVSWTMTVISEGEKKVTVSATSVAYGETFANQFPFVIEAAPPPPGGGTIVTPSSITITKKAGESHTEIMSVSTGSTPIPSIDVVFTIDLTGSMGDEISVVKTKAVEIMNGIRAQVPDSQFGLATFMDYPGTYSYPGYSAQYGSAASGDYAYKTNVHITDNINQVATAINGLFLGWGADGPQDYTRVLYEVMSSHWRAGTKKIVIMFGDAPTHDLNFAGYNFGGDPGRDGIAMTADDLDFETVVGQLKQEKVTVIAVDSGFSAQSAATFKGMSIGFAGAPGTNGQYFQLTNASQIPTAVANLVQAEVQKIDELNLDIPAPYNTWVSYSPNKHTNVGPNTTVSFNLTITVPTGQPSGEYTFLIRAIGDGALLGETFVTIIVPPTTISYDLGFRANPNGYGFANFSTTQNWQMFEQFLGTENVRHLNGDRVYVAEQFFNNYYQHAGSGGSCDGFSATSLLNFKNLAQPNAGTFAMPHHNPLYPVALDDTIRNVITYQQGFWLGYEIPSYNAQEISNPPSFFYNKIKQFIQNGAPVILSLWQPGNGGHSIVPYKVEDVPADNRGYVYVYDNNHPGDDNRRVEFDLNADTWQYQFSSSSTWTGNASSKGLTVIPLSMRLNQGIPFWNTGATTQQAVIVAAVGPTKMIITDDSGKKIGFQDGGYISDIQGAIRMIAPFLPPEDTPLPFDAYYLPTDRTYQVSARSGSSGEADFGIIGEGFIIQIEDVPISSETGDKISFTNDGTSVTYSTNENNKSYSVVIAKELPDTSRVFTIGNTTLSSGEEVTFELTNDQQSITYTNTGSAKTYDLTIEQRGTNVGTFTAQGIALGANESQTVQVDDWINLGTTQVHLLIDEGNDGTIDREEILEPPSTVENVTAMIRLDKFSSRFDRATGQYLMMATLTNIGADPLSELQMIIETVTPNTVTVANADGTTDGGKPYYDYSTLLGDGTLDPGETSGSKQLAFNNPSRVTFSFDVSVWGKVNGGPAAPSLKPLVSQPQRIHIAIPMVSALAQNYPNPFNPETWIPYELAEASRVTISIYDLQGKLVRTLDVGHREVGQYFSRENAAYWDGRNNAGERVSSGVYFYQIHAGDFHATKKMVILK